MHLLLLRGWTMTNLAAESGLSLTTISGLAQGDHRASDRTIQAIAGALVCEPSILFPELAGFELRAEELVG